MKIETHPYQSMVNIIEQFKASTLFFYSFAKEGLEIKLLIETRHNNMYEAVLEYYLDCQKIFTIGGQFSFPLIEVKPEKKFYFFSLDAFIQAAPHLAKMQKVVVSKTLEGNNYTLISQLFNEGELAGSTWEIYPLPELTDAYHKRKVKASVD